MIFKSVLPERLKAFILSSSLKKNTLISPEGSLCAAARGTLRFSVTILTTSFTGAPLSLWMSESIEGRKVAVISLGEARNGMVEAGGGEAVDDARICA